MADLIQRYHVTSLELARLRAKQVARFVGLTVAFILGLAVLAIAYVAGNVFTV